VLGFRDGGVMWERERQGFCCLSRRLALRIGNGGGADAVRDMRVCDAMAPS
jgi:hypothetical protein